MNIDRFISDISSIKLANVFNPYADLCEIFDTADAPKIRQFNLKEFIRVAIELEIDTMWMGRDLGYRGGRRTGLALTDEKHLSSFSSIYNGAYIRKSTNGPIVKERTAEEIWTILSQLKRPPLLWNVFPFHPHELDNQMTNRKFTASELRVAEEINMELIRGIGIKKIVAIGNDAAMYSVRLGVSLDKVRHPSYGGISDFRAGIKSLYSLQ